VPLCAPPPSVPLTDQITVRSSGPHCWHLCRIDISTPSDSCSQTISCRVSVCPTCTLAEASTVMPFESLAKLNGTDVNALHAYLRTLPARDAGHR
jgi:hypothetical protein